jgi:purine-nucleoside phosphorylase
MLLKQKIKIAADRLSDRIAETPVVAIILGSGLGDFHKEIKNAATIPVGEIPFYPQSTVPGHEGRWLFGSIGDTATLVIQGRVHYYEGYTLSQVTFPVHLAASLGIDNLIVTTASGGLNPEFKPGDLMLMTDFINFSLANPLRGDPRDQLGPRFPYMHPPFDTGLSAIAAQTGKDLGMPFKRGVFCWVPGPAYETAAEVRALRLFGADAVSMSTVPEVIVARQRHLRVLGISLITNLATGYHHSELTHHEVIHTANRASIRFTTVMSEIIRRIGTKGGTTKTEDTGFD